MLRILRPSWRSSPADDAVSRDDAAPDVVRLDVPSPGLRRRRPVALAYVRHGAAHRAITDPGAAETPAYVLTDAPRGLPGSLPARVAGTAQQSTVVITYRAQRLTMAYQGSNFPPFPTDTTVYGLLVVDDSTQRAQGVLLYEGQRPPQTYPQLGS